MLFREKNAFALQLLQGPCSCDLMTSEACFSLQVGVSVPFKLSALARTTTLVYAPQSDDSSKIVKKVS